MMRRRHPAFVILALGALLIALDLAMRLLPLIIAAGVVLAVVAVTRRRSARRGLPGRPAWPAADLAAERDDLRRQVAKLEADAARREQLVDDLEDAAGRPIEAVIASYRHIQQQYGAAAVGKTGRRP